MFYLPRMVLFFKTGPTLKKTFRFLAPLETSVDLATFHSNNQLTLSSHCLSDGQGSPIHHVPMTLCLYATMSTHIYYCTYNVVFYGEEIVLCTHGSIKSGETKHKPRRLYVSKKNRKGIFCNRIKHYSDI